MVLFSRILSPPALAAASPPSASAKADVPAPAAAAGAGIVAEGPPAVDGSRVGGDCGELGGAETRSAGPPSSVPTPAQTKRLLGF